MGGRVGGPLCQWERPICIDEGTMCLAPSPLPSPLAADGVASWNWEAKLLEAARRTTPKLPLSMQAEFAALFTPEAIGITSAVLAIWAGSHFVGAGEIADVGLLIFGVAMMGRAAIDAARHFKNFFSIALDANSFSDLDLAASHLAQAVAMVGVTVFIAAVMKVGRRVLKRTGKSGSTRVKPSRPNGTPSIGSAYDPGHKVATWPGDVESMVKFIVEEAAGKPISNGTVVLDYIKRGAPQPSGSAGIMFADALRQAGVPRPKAIQVPNIIQKSPQSTAMIRQVVLDAIEELGGRAGNITEGVELGKKFLNIEIVY